MTWAIERVDLCDSTQDVAAAREAAGVPDRTVVVAGSMRDGRGTRGRGWHAPEGGLYASFILRDPPAPHLLTLAVGNAVADVLEVAGVDARIKWVNDVVVAERKIAGILVEAESSGERVDVAIVGIGINVNGDASTWPHPLNGTAVTLESLVGGEQCIEDLETVLWQSLDDWFGKLADGRSSEVVDAWRARDAIIGRRVGFDPDGDLCTKILGTAAGVTDDGHLRIETDDGEQIFAAGSVFLA